MTHKSTETVSDILRCAIRRLIPIAHEESAQQAKALLCFSLNLNGDMFELLKRLPTPITKTETEAFEKLICRRLTGEPLQYILGEWEFMGLDFFVDKRALIPRQDTETLVETALNISREIKYCTALDVCCGSGCIGIALCVLGNMSVTMSDISDDALMLAHKNCVRHNADRIILKKSDLFSDICGRYDIICINPPYLTESEMKHLQLEVTYEPEIALFGGMDGLTFYRRIAEGYEEHLADNGTLLLEIGSTQADAVTSLFPDAKIICDICGNARVAAITHTSDITKSSRSTKTINKDR